MTDFPVELQSVDFNPASREPLQFAEVIPGRLSVNISRLAWILAQETYLDGFDTSHWNFSEGREMDFAVAKANGFDFGILKATQGNWFVDDEFDYSWRACIGNGIIPIVYHFFDDFTSGFEQAQWCISNLTEFLNLVDGKTIIFDDVEVKTKGVTVSQRQNRAKAFNETIAEEGFLTGNYSSYYLWSALMGNTPLPWVNKYLQWVAHWTPGTEPLLPIGWTKAMTKFWQYGISPAHSWAKKVGTDGNVDVNRFYGTVEDLKDLLGITPPVSPDCCEEVKAMLAIVQQDIIDMSNRINGVDNRLTTEENKTADIYSRLNTLNTSVDLLTKNMSVHGNRIGNTEADITAIKALISRTRNAFCS